MIVRVDIKTGKQTIIEPMDNEDCKGLEGVLKVLYYQHEKEKDVIQQER